MFEETNDGIKLSWGSSARSCGDTLDVSCEQAKAEVTIPATQLVPGARLLLTNLRGQFAASFIDGEGAGCSTGQQTLAGTAEIFSTTPNEIRFRIEGNEFGTTSVDGYYSATRCN
ncbi:MAG: hypothetical protein R3B07_00500 [Polyangiaceae bacterium]